VSNYAFFRQQFYAQIMNPAGGVARELEAAADTMVGRAKDALGEDAPRPWGSVPHPPPGPPWRRTGDLQNSIQRTAAIPGAPNPLGPDIAAYVTAYSEHGGVDYAAILRERGYKFFREGDLEGGAV